MVSSSSAGVIGAGISSGAGLIGSIINAIQAPKLQQQAYESDLYNNLELAKYNNDYNYNLWKEQMEYNSPVNQRKRLEEAGLNPNFNSIDGAGNASSAPTSQIPTNLHHSADLVQQRAQLRLASINSFAEQISRFINNFSTLSGIPSDIPFARELALSQLMSNRTLTENKQYREFINGLWDAYQKFGIDYTGHTLDAHSKGPNGEYLQVVDMANSPLAKKIGLSNANLQLQSEIRSIEQQLKQYDLNNLKPWELIMLQNRAALLGEQYGLTKKQNDWFKVNAVTKLGAMSIGSLLGLAKVFK